MNMEKAYDNTNHLPLNISMCRFPLSLSESDLKCGILFYCWRCSDFLTCGFWGDALERPGSHAQPARSMTN